MDEDKIDELALFQKVGEIESEKEIRKAERIRQHFNHTKYFLTNPRTAIRSIY